MDVPTRGAEVPDHERLIATADAAGVPVAPWVPAQWRYRVYDLDGRLLYTGLTYIRPTWTDTPSRSGTTDRPASANRRDTDSDTPTVMPGHAIPEAPGVIRIRPLPPNPPPQRDPTARYPSAPMRRWIAARDNTCRAPGCTHPARTCDIDHTQDHTNGGPTQDDNLGLLCRHHHRMKHETDHHLDQPEPGTFRWTTPHGKTHDITPEPPPS